MKLKPKNIRVEEDTSRRTGKPTTAYKICLCGDRGGIHRILYSSMRVPADSPQAKALKQATEVVADAVRARLAEVEAFTAYE